MTTWITLTEYAAARGINRRTAQAWAREGRINATRTAGGHWRVDKREVRRRLYSISEVAEALGRSPRTVRSWAEAGTIATLPCDCGVWLVEARELKRLVAVENEGGRSDG